MKRWWRYREKQNIDNPFWISIGDLMAGLLMLFILLTAFAYFQISDYHRSQRAVFKLLREKLELIGIKPEVDAESGTITIADEILFESNQPYLRYEGKIFLSKFIPILDEVLFSDIEIESEIVSIDIVGYASQKGFQELNMMQLSLERSLSVWEFIHDLHKLKNREQFLKKLKICGWGNMKATSANDFQDDRKVVFEFQFKSVIEKMKKQFMGKISIEQ